MALRTEKKNANAGVKFATEQGVDISKINFKTKIDAPSGSAGVDIYVQPIKMEERETTIDLL